MNFTGIPSAKVPEIWPFAEELVSSAVERSGELSAQDILDALLSRNMQLWAAFDNGLKAIAVTEIQVLPRKKLGSILICTGEGRKEWEYALSIIEDWARSEGCTGMKLLARPGWERVLKDYRKTHVLLEKEL